MPFPRKIYREEALERGHSEEYLDEILGYADTLESKNLPVIYSLLHFSLLIGLDFYTTKHIVNSREEFYKKYQIR